MNPAIDIFASKSCLEVLKARVEEEGGRPGYKASLAAAAGFHPSFLSHVMKGDAQLSAEHAVGIARFWSLTESETEYFVELTHLARATTSAMKDYLNARLAQIRKRGERKLLKGAARPLDGDSAKTLYYSTWYYSAIHIATTIPALQTSAAISRRLSLPIDVTERALVDLQRMGLVERKATRWIATELNLSVSGDHFARAHSVHWALRATQDLQVKRDASSLFRTSVYSVSKSDLLKLRQELLRQIRVVDDLAIPSPGEELVCIHWHLFTV